MASALQGFFRVLGQSCISRNQHADMGVIVAGLVTDGEAVGHLRVEGHEHPRCNIIKGEQFSPKIELVGRTAYIARRLLKAPRQLGALS